MMAQIVLHWGNSGNNHGSEHQVDGHQYAVEMQCVHFKEEYGSLANAMNQPDGLVIVAAFFEEGQHHDELDKILEPAKEHLSLMHRSSKVSSLQSSSIRLFNQIIVTFTS